MGIPNIDYSETNDFYNKIKMRHKWGRFDCPIIYKGEEIMVRINVENDDKISWIAKYGELDRRTNNFITLHDLIGTNIKDIEFVNIFDESKIQENEKHHCLMLGGKIDENGKPIWRGSFEN